ncbi:N-(5\'phosphoribosyl)anthranilate isomerase [gamma proteobacterium HdN1]|nr:N-(5\'phosphoribosyl)anthranilate isomerase [gamma proteobacterium HdN1]
MTTRVKICGITRLQDALDAAELGADALGFVFYEPSPRNIEIAQAAAIIAQLPPFVCSVGLFVNPSREWVNTVMAAVPLDLLQFHGDETDQFCQQFSRPWIKAIRMADSLELDKEIRKYPHARGILLDAYDPQRYGGTGHTFEWQRAQQALSKPIIVAGGLTPQNVTTAITAAHPWAVDVSGGVEQAKGIKQRSLIEAFIQGAKRGEKGRFPEHTG